LSNVRRDGAGLIVFYDRSPFLQKSSLHEGFRSNGPKGAGQQAKQAMHLLSLVRWAAWPAGLIIRIGMEESSDARQ
jgi:hypothetical protein